MGEEVFLTKRKVKTDFFLVEEFGWWYLENTMDVTEAGGDGRVASDDQEQTNSSISNRVKAQFPNDESHVPQRHPHRT